MQVYRPLYEGAYAYRHDGLFELRPPQMFFRPAMGMEKMVGRFTRLIEPDVIMPLQAIEA